MAEFKFKIGDLVVHRGAERTKALSKHEFNFDASPKMPMSPTMVVVERITQECPGGTQLKYMCKTMAYGILQFSDHLEIELDLAPESLPTKV